APVTESDVVGAFADTTRFFQQGPLAHYMPYTPRTESQIRELAALKPRVCATMHGSTFVGEGDKALLDMGAVMKELLGRAEKPGNGFEVALQLDQFFSQVIGGSHIASGLFLEPHEQFDAPFQRPDR